MLSILSGAGGQRRCTAAGPRGVFAWASRCHHPNLVDQVPRLTTLGCFGPPPTAQFVQAAHARGTRVVRAVSVNTTLIHTAAGRAGIIRELTVTVTVAGLDGLNFDEESYAGPPEDFSSLIRELQAALPVASSLSLAVSAWPDNPHYKQIHYRTGLNFTALGAIVDYMVVMGYDMSFIEPCSHSGNCSRTPLWPPLANAPSDHFPDCKIRCGSTGRWVPPSQLVLALPWYGRDCTCAPDLQTRIMKLNNDAKTKTEVGSAASWRQGSAPPPCTILTPDVGRWPCAGCYTHLRSHRASRA